MVASTHNDNFAHATCDQRSRVGGDKQYVCSCRSYEKPGLPFGIKLVFEVSQAIKGLPLVARRSVTFDRGTEFVSWPHLQPEIGTQTWFCDPSSPWQKDTVENTNRRVRRWLPHKRDIRGMTDHDIKQICDQLNNTARKYLGWKTPD
jgi:IS30 family transposase